jgi:hypothetical protein
VREKDYVRRRKIYKGDHNARNAKKKSVEVNKLPISQPFP